jgi:hypothetical protein
MPDALLGRVRMRRVGRTMSTQKTWVCVDSQALQASYFFLNGDRELLLLPEPEKSIHDLATPIDEKRLRQEPRAGVRIADLPIIEQNRIPDSLRRRELRDLRFLPGIIHRDSDDLEPPCAISGVKLREHRHFDTARRAPRCPEIQQHDFALEFGQSNSPVIETAERECWRRLALQLLDGATGARRRAQVWRSRVSASCEHDNR